MQNISHSTIPRSVSLNSCSSPITKMDFQIAGLITEGLDNASSNVLDDGMEALIKYNKYNISLFKDAMQTLMGKQIPLTSYTIHGIDVPVATTPDQRFIDVTKIVILHISHIYNGSPNTVHTYRVATDIVDDADQRSYRTTLTDVKW